MSTSVRARTGPAPYSAGCKKMKTKNRNQATDSLYLPGTDGFINKCIVIYKDKSNDNFKKSLVLCVLKAFFAKMSGEVNPVYSPNVFNFYLALSATSRKIFDSVSRKLLGPSIQNIQRRR